MEISVNEYQTFLFKETEEGYERNTYSAFIPEKDRGIWCIGESKGKRENFIKTGITEIIRSYMEDSSITMEKMEKMLNEANRKIILNRISINEDFIKGFNLTAGIIEGKRMIIGNIGNTKLKIYRGNSLFYTITGNRIKEVNLKKKDCILMGSEDFWKEVKDEEIIGKLNDSGILEKYIDDKIRKTIKNRRIEIPFSLIFIQSLKEEETEAGEMEKINNPFNFFMVMLVVIFFFTATGKSITDYRNNVKNALSKNILKEAVNSKAVMDIQEKVNKSKEEFRRNIINNVSKEEKKVLELAEKESKEKGSKSKVKEINRVRILGSRQVKGGNRKKRKENIKTGDRISSKLEISDLDYEIEENWRILENYERKDTKDEGVRDGETAIEIYD